MNTEDYREQIAKALKEVHRQGLHEDSGNGEPCYCMVEPAILSLIESEKVKAVEPFRQAMVNKGSHPEYHDQQVAYLKQHWPTLYNLLKELESKEEAK